MSHQGLTNISFNQSIYVGNSSPSYQSVKNYNTKAISIHKDETVATSLKCLRKRSTGLKVCLSILLTLSDLLVCMVAGIIMVFANYVILGLKASELMKYGPSLMTECAVSLCYFGAFFNYKRYAEFNKRHSVWVCWIINYGFLFCVSLLSTFITYEVINYVWFARYVNNINFVPTVPVMIAFHQLLTFVVLTSHNSWFGGILLKGVDPFAGTVLYFFVTWIIWGIFVSHITHIDNLGQMGGYIYWIPLTNLFSASIFSQMKITFKNTGTRAGYLALATNIVNILSWAVCYGISYGLYRAYYESGEFTPSHMGHSIWSMSVITWMTYYIVGHRLSPLFFRSMCQRSHSRFGYSLPMLGLYFLICTAIYMLFAVCMYLYFNYVIYDAIICDVLHPAADREMCKSTPWWERPVYYFGLGVGTYYAVFAEVKEKSRDNPRPEGAEDTYTPERNDKGMDITVSNIV